MLNLNANVLANRFGFVAFKKADVVVENPLDAQYDHTPLQEYGDYYFFSTANKDSEVFFPEVRGLLLDANQASTSRVKPVWVSEKPELESSDDIDQAQQTTLGNYSESSQQQYEP